MGKSSQIFLKAEKACRIVISQQAAHRPTKKGRYWKYYFNFEKNLHTSYKGTYRTY